ncbi:MAG: MFS transporter [Gemmataceae bacterium]
MHDPPTRPTRTRFVVLAFLCALAFVLYLDRVCISQAATSIKADLGLSNQAFSFVLMAFTLAYGIFEVPTGHWGDRIGSRAVLTRIAVWWSAFTAFTAACTGFYSLIVVRFLFGAGEAGAFPNVARIVARWYPPRERGRIQGFIQTAALVGGAAAPMVAAYLIRDLGWRWAFVVFGLTGVVWAGIFYLWFRDDPEHHSSVNPAELELIGPPGSSGSTHHAAIPWRAALSCPSIWLLGFITTCGAFNSYFYFSWYPTYLKEGRGLDNIVAGQLASLGLAFGAAGTLSGGFLADWARSTPRKRLVGSVSFVLAAIALFASVFADQPLLAAILAALSVLAAQATLSIWWSSAIEISGRHLGALFGLMNGMGVFGAMGSQFFVGAFVDWRKHHGHEGREQWDPIFAVYVVVLLLAAVSWACYQSRPVEEPHETHPA